MLKGKVRAHYPKMFSKLTDLITGEMLNKAVEICINYTEGGVKRQHNLMIYFQIVSPANKCI